MNIIYIVNFDIYKLFSGVETIGGIEVVTNQVIQELKNRDHNVWIPSKNERPNWVKEGNIDIICASSFDPLTLFELFRFKRKYHNAAVVQHAHTTYEDLKGNVLPDNPIVNKILESWIRLLYSQSHLIITPSEYSRKRLINIQKTRTYPIYPVSNGVIIEKFKKKEKYRTNFRDYLAKNFNIPKDATIILNVGLIWKRKRVDTFGKVAKNLPDYYFVWVGPLGNDPDIEEIEKLDNVIFTGFYDDIREPYYGSDIFLCTSEEENQGIPLIEASLCKLPIVARDIEVFKWLTHNESIYKGESASDFIEGIQKILSNSEYKTKLVDNAYKTAKEIHDFNNVMDKIEKLFRKAKKIKRIWDKKR